MLKKKPQNKTPFWKTIQQSRGIEKLIPQRKDDSNWIKGGDILVCVTETVHL